MNAKDVIKRSLMLGSLVVAVGCKSNCLEMKPLNWGYGLPSNIEGTFSVVNKCKKDAQGNPTPVTGLEKEKYKTLGAYEIFLEKGDRPPKSLLSEFEAAKIVYMSPRSYELSATLLLDLSGSISKSDEELQSLKDAAKRFVERATDANGRDVKVSVFTFDGREEIIPLIERTSNKEDILKAISAISCSESTGLEYCQDPSTNLNGAIIKGVEAVRGYTKKVEKELSAHTLVIFTDGTDQADRESHFTAKSQVEKLMVKEGHKVFTVGVGMEIDKKKLKELGPSGQFFASSKKDLNKVFEKAADNIRDIATSVYTVRYCTAKRNKRQELSFGVRKGNSFGYVSGLVYDATGMKGGCNPNDDKQWTEESLNSDFEIGRMGLQRNTQKDQYRDIGLQDWHKNYVKEKKHKKRLKEVNDLTKIIDESLDKAIIKAETLRSNHLEEFRSSLELVKNTYRGYLHSKQIVDSNTRKIRGKKKRAEFEMHKNIITIFESRIRSIQNNYISYVNRVMADVKSTMNELNSSEVMQRIQNTRRIERLPLEDVIAHVQFLFKSKLSYTKLDAIRFINTVEQLDDDSFILKGKRAFRDTDEVSNRKFLEKLLELERILLEF